jgi:hypothetical protein
MYENVSKGDRVTMIHLFGIKYAKESKEGDFSVKEILKSAQMPESYQTEVHKGI